jgi:electron transfer flavoprotein alpha subunit
VHIVALVKQVPHHDAECVLDETGRLRRAGVPTELNPFCRRAVAHAVQLARPFGGVTTAVTMGPPAATDVLDEARACGVDHAVHVSDPQLAGSDCLATARALAAALALLPPADLIVVGRNSIDSDTGLVGPMIAELLGRPFIGPAMRLEPDRQGSRLRATLQHDDAEEVVEVRLPAVVSVAERSISPAKAPPHEWPTDGATRYLSTQDLGTGLWGEAASGTLVRQVRAVRPHRAGGVPTGGLDEQVARVADLVLAAARSGSATRLDSTPPPGPLEGPAIAVLAGTDSDRHALIGEAAVLAERIGGHVVASAVSGDDTASLLVAGADALLLAPSPEPRPLATALAGELSEAWAVLAPATGWGRELAARLAVQLDAGVIADAIELLVQPTPEGALRLVGHKPAGSGTVADIVCRTRVQLATVRTGCLPVREPRLCSFRGRVRRLDVSSDPGLTRVARRRVDDDSALDRAKNVIGVGRGVAPGEYPQLEQLRGLLAAELAATRPVTDAGWLPHGRQVGVTARNIGPQLYLAIGIAGSTNHTSGIARAGTVVAINDDPDAAIFQQSDAGIVADWRVAVPALVAELSRRREQIGVS